MLRTIAKIWPLFFALSLLMIGNGLQGSLLGLRAGVEGFTTTVIGLLMSFYYAGFVASSFLTPRLVKEAGHIRVFAAFASVVSSIVLLHAVFVDTLLWIILRFIGGFAIAGLYVVVESWLNDIASNKTRGRLFGMYIINTHMCLGLGQLSLTIVDPSDVNSFIFVAILVSLSVVPISLGKGSQPMVEQVESMSIISLYQKAPLGLIACLFVGMAQSAFMSMGAVYGTAIGLSTSQIGFLFSLPLLSVVIAQLPIGILSDYFDRRLMLALLSFVVAFCGGIAAMINPTEFVLLMALFTVYGSLSVPLYSLAVAHANDVLPSSQMLSASSSMVFVYGLGSVIGPFIAGLSMQFIGSMTFFMMGSVIHFCLGLFAVFRIMQRPPVIPEERGGFVTLGVRATPIATVAAIEDAQDSVDNSLTEK